MYSSFVGTFTAVAVLIVVFDPNSVKAAETVSCDYVSGNVVSSNLVSGDYVSGNVVSGNFITFDQGDQIINYLRMIIFFLVFSFSFDRIRNGLRSFNKTR